MKKKRFGKRLTATAMSLLLIAGNFSGTTTESFVYAEEDSSDSGAGQAEKGNDVSGDAETGEREASKGTGDSSSSDAEKNDSSDEAGDSDTVSGDKKNDSSEDGSDENKESSKDDASGADSEGTKEENKDDMDIDNPSSSDNNTDTETDINENTGETGASGETKAEETEASTDAAEAAKVGETEEIKETVDETLPLETEEARQEVELLFHVVDEDGQDIEDKYNDVNVSFGKDGILLLDDSENPPVRKVRRKIGSHLFGLIKTYSKNYTYKEATLNGDVIKAIRKTKSEEEGTVYEYTLDGTEWTELDDDAEILLVYTAPDSQSVGHAEYIEEGRIKVSVDMNKELPEGVELRVSELKSDDNNYQAYMAALDESAKESDSELKEHTEENTMLYDIAFIGTDEDGQEYEYQPGEDVSVRVSFLGGQLAGELGATDASNIEVKHLPIKNDVKENAANDGKLTTADITDLSAKDIDVEDVKKAKVTLDKSAVEEAESVDFDEEEDESEDEDREEENEIESSDSKDEVAFGVSSFCIFSFTNGTQNNGTYWEGTDTIAVKSFKDTLGLAGHVAVYADEYYLKNCSHLEGSVAVNTYKIDGNRQLNANGNVESQNKVVEITLTKEVETSETTDRTFKVGFFASKDPDSATEAVDTIDVTVPANETSGSIILTESTHKSIFETLKTQTLYVYEIDSRGNVAKTEYIDSDGNKKYDVIYTDEEESEVPNEILGEKNMLGNYIKTIELTTGNYTMEPNFFGTEGFHTYLGSDYADQELNGANGHLNIYKANGDLNIVLQNYKGFLKESDEIDKYIHNLDEEEFEARTKLDENLGEDGKFAEESVRLANAKRGTTTGKTNFNVINLISKYGNLQSDLENYAGFKSTVNSGGEAIKDLLQDCEKNDEYLLINIDASNFRDKYTLTKLVIDGVEPDSNSTFPRTGSHVVYNIVQKNEESKEFEPYTGTIDTSNVVGGTIFAPLATYDMSGGFRGGVIADTVLHTGSEIHQKAFGSSERRYVNITIMSSEPGPDPTPIPTPTPKKAKATLTAQKELNGQELKDGQFSFELRDSSGNVLQTKKNNARGIINFAPLTYDEVGTHTYTITEIAGTDKHYTYDDRVINVTVTVALNAAGELEATVEYPDGDIFTNKYTPDKPEIHMNVNKYEATGAEELDGAKLQIIDKNGNVVGTWISKKGQSHDFGSALKTGESYTLHEEAAPDGYEKIQDVTFTVEENGQITINGSPDGIEFENDTYKILDTKSEPTDDGKKETEETKGDDGKKETEETKGDDGKKETEETKGDDGNKGGDNGGGHSDHKKDTTPGRSTPGRNVAETEAPGEVLGAERERENPEVEIVEESEGTVKGVSRRKARTGDDSMMRAFGLGFFGALVLLLGWTVIYFRRKKK